MLQPVLGANWWAIVQRDFEQHELHDNHETGLEEERVAVVCPEPVEDPVNICQDRHATPTRGTSCVLEYRGHEHDERDVKGEAITAFRAVDREDLVSIRGYRGEDEARRQCQRLLFRLAAGSSHNKGAK